MGKMDLKRMPKTVLSKSDRLDSGLVRKSHFVLSNAFEEFDVTIFSVLYDGGREISETSVKVQLKHLREFITLAGEKEND